MRESRNSIKGTQKFCKEQCYSFYDRVKTFVARWTVFPLNTARRHHIFMSLITIIAIGCLAPDGTAQWRQWGGPDRNFSVQDVHLAESWDTRAPQLLWKRPLGGGHAGILIDDGRLYVPYGEDGVENIAALDPKTGETVWKATWDADFQARTKAYDGPHATPAISGDRLVTVSIDAQVHAFDKRTGAKLWNRDLVKSHQVYLPQSGYAASPLIWRDLILLPGLGRTGPGAIALDIESGETRWARHSFRSSHASPIQIRFNGSDHAIFHGMDWLYALDPATGDVLWKHKVRSRAADNVSFTPIWDGKNQQLVLSHGFDAKGARGLRLSTKEGATRVVQRWTNGRLQVRHGNGILIDDVLYGSAGGDPGFFAAIDVTDGKLLWKIRLPKSTLLAVGSKMLVLDEDGSLMLATPTREGLNVKGKKSVLSYNAWTVPTLVGDTLYLRDRFHILALDLPAATF